MNIHINGKFDASVNVWKINDVMKDLKRGIEARESVGDTKRAKSHKQQETQSKGCYQ